MTEDADNDCLKYETPRELLTRLKLSREEAMQRLLTSLILDAPYPRWNTPQVPSAIGLEWLCRVHELSFGDGWENGEPVFIDEFELRGLTDDERGGAPDYALLWPGRVWMIELKSEAASHRADQLPMYLDLAHRHFPGAAIDLTYLTPPLQKSGPLCAPWARYAHLTWQQIRGLIRSTWPSPTSPSQAEVIDGLCEAIEMLERPPAEWRAHVVGTPEVEPAPAPLPAEVGHAAAAATADDGVQRGLDVAAGSLDELLELRFEIKKMIQAQSSGSPLRRVRPWIWRQESSGGAPLTRLGALEGYELRVSRYEKPV